MPTLPKIFRPVTRNIVIFYLAFALLLPFSTLTRGRFVPNCFTLEVYVVNCIDPNQTVPSKGSSLIQIQTICMRCKNKDWFKSKIWKLEDFKLKCKTRTRSCKTYFMPNSTRHELYDAHKCSHFNIY